MGTPLGTGRACPFLVGLVSGRIPGSYGADDLLPAGGKIRGGNISASLHAETDGVVGVAPENQQTSAYLWAVEWRDFDNASWITHNLDLAVLQGCNVVRVIGSINGIRKGYYTRAQYHAKWDLLRDMCVARGLYLYPCAQSTTYDEFSSIATGDYLAEVVAWAQHINDYQRCIGIDLVSEGDTFAQSTAGLNLYNAVKQVTNLPLTYSFVGSGGDPTLATVRAATANRRDFADIHQYFNPSASAVETAYWGVGQTQPFLVGEFGSPVSAGQSTQTARFQAIHDEVAYVGASARRLAGAFVWSIQDSDTTPGNQYGLYDLSNVERTYLSTVFATFPKA